MKKIIKKDKQENQEVKVIDGAAVQGAINSDYVIARPGPRGPGPGGGENLFNFARYY